MLTIHLRINDAATGKPTPVRLRISSAETPTFAPLGRVAEFPCGRNEEVGGHLRVGRERWCYIDGACEVKLPAGTPLRVQATKGPEFQLIDETVTLGAGQMALRFTMDRWANSAAEGWISGDTRCHFLAPDTAELEAAAEDLHVVNILACAQSWPSFDGKTYPSYPQLLAFSGQDATRETAGGIVAVNTLNVHPALGRVGLLHSHRIVFPLTFGGEETDDWSVCDWCDQCHRKQGLTVWVEPFRPQAGLVGGEALVAAILGKIDAIEISDPSHSHGSLAWIYRLWNAGFPLPLVGGSGKDRNAIALGSMRTYAHVGTGEAVTYRGWIEAVRAGRCFATSGPLLRLHVDDTGRIEATATSARPFDSLEIVADGQVIQAGAPVHDSTCFTARIEMTASPPGTSWLAARVIGSQGTFAHTSPHALSGRVKHDTTLLKQIDATRDWIAHEGRFEQLKSKAHLEDLCHAARARLGEPV